jgi:hypothetical protein
MLMGPIPNLPRACRTGQAGGSVRPWPGAPDGPDAREAAASGSPGAAGPGYLAGPLRLPQATSGVGPLFEDPKVRLDPPATLGYAEKVRPQFLSLRQLAQGPVFSGLTRGQLSPVIAAISHLGAGLPTGRAGRFFSERPNSLRSSGPHPFSTFLEIRTFGAAYELQRKKVLPLLSDRRERLMIYFGDKTNEKWIITGFAIVNYGSERQRRLIFDWCATTLRRCVFWEYINMWDCKFDSNTRFDNSILRDILAPPQRIMHLSKTLFSPNCDLPENVADKISLLADQDLKAREFIRSRLQFLLLKFLNAGRVSYTLGVFALNLPRP